MKKVIGIGLLLFVAIIAGVHYSAKTPSLPTASTGGNASEDKGGIGLSNESDRYTIDAPKNDVSSQKENPSNQALNDPRFAALAVSRDTGNIAFIPGKNGKIIKELDNNPNSPNFNKPLREYTYAGDKVIGLTAYQYLPGYTQKKETKVSYKADGSILNFYEATDYIYTKKK